MDPVHPEFHPEPGMSQAEMTAQQRDIARTARFENAGHPTPETVAIDRAPDLDSRVSATVEDPIVVGVDQAFEDETAVSALVAIQNGDVVDVACGRSSLRFPYVPGLLAFREAPAIIDGMASLSVEPDLLVFDGSGRIHYREAGIATHLGVLFDVPAVGVAKNLLCGTPDRSLEDPLPEGQRVAIRADEDVEADQGTVLGYAFQSRQFPNPTTRHVNPIYVSPGHRVGPEMAVSLVEALGTGYKLPEPVRLADTAASACKS